MAIQGGNQSLLSIRGLAVSYGRNKAAAKIVKHLDLDVAEGEMFVLLGPSGCGKTTLLRAVAGLQVPSAGNISIDGSLVHDAESGTFIPPERRPVSMVFQSYALWPHMTVAENVAFPLREGGRGVPRAEVDGRVTEVLDMLGLSGMRDRPVTTLSGGQQQRVALARALALRPRLLLMDEPLSNLDYELQVRLRSQVKELVSRIGVTTLYVTHNQHEALEMADRLAVMDAGEFRQIGTPRELYLKPSSEFVARFIGDMNLVPATVVGRDAEGRHILDSALGRLVIGTSCLSDATAGQFCLFGIRQEDFEFSENDTKNNVVTANVEVATFSGDAISYRFNVNGVSLRARLHRRFDVPAGQSISLRLAPEHCLAVPHDAAREAT